MSSCASSMSKQPNRARAEFFARRQNLKDFSESRPLMRVAGILRRRISSNRFGHNSLSTNIANCGDQWSRKRFTQSGRSSGKYWCVSRSISGKLACFNWPTSVAEVRVPVVMRICVSGRAAKKSASKGKAERVSPTDAACSQTRFPAGRGAMLRALRSSKRAGSSRPALARRSSRSGKSPPPSITPS